MSREQLLSMMAPTKREKAITAARNELHAQRLSVIELSPDEKNIEGIHPLTVLDDPDYWYKYYSIAQVLNIYPYEKYNMLRNLRLVTGGEYEKLMTNSGHFSFGRKRSVRRGSRKVRRKSRKRSRKRKRSVRRGSRKVRRKSKKRSRKKCQYGRKTSGACKRKPGPKKRRSYRRRY